jgi:hypothetical protein
MPERIINFESANRRYPILVEYAVESEACECRPDVDGSRDRWTNETLEVLDWHPIGYAIIDDTLYDEISKSLV